MRRDKAGSASEAGPIPNADAPAATKPDTPGVAGTARGSPSRRTRQLPRRAAGCPVLRLRTRHHGRGTPRRRWRTGRHLWLARICQFGLALPSFAPPRRFLAIESTRPSTTTACASAASCRTSFGLNGRRILDGLVARQPPNRIVDGLTIHVQAKLEPLARALAATLDPVALLRLRMRLNALDRADAAIAVLDTHIRTELADYQPLLQLLQAIRGIDAGSACTILVEIGPDVGVFREARHLGAWAEAAPGNNTSAGKRRSGRARPGDPTLRATLAECAHGAARTTGSQFHG